MYNDYREWEDFPVMFIDGVFTMSITPLEIASHYCVINRAHGKIGVGGLGLGYFVQNILDKPGVDSVIVYETNKDVIEMYDKLFGTHSKLIISEEDVRKIEGQVFDFFYCDVYDGRLEVQVITDYHTITSRNVIKQYYFWGVEEFVMSVVAHRNESETIKQFPKYWSMAAIELYGDLNESPKRKLIDLKAGCEELIDEFEGGGEINE